ncbi:uncharacterized protein UV8b_02528 [Ustilaginoidea virens]|uniref:DUF1750-domain-containing protein n=1 Tax=Ustilaginoidea virens TaxID=1159556 RepID=A0A8E5MFX7_USTVR|nr:uncharacterized protein UV8b_02528 [Ustilaginoidea virens]QUC18287.1 hypothetical protein UV8b_02528 [Ustilaginoidea virens]
MAQPDPSSSVPQDLMPHVHLVSSYRYPTMPRLDLSEVAKWLMTAPQIARDRAPFFWTYLDKPADGTILLTWQPLQRLGTNFATDGFVWAPPEQVYKHDLGNGLMLEIYYLKTGYIPGEQYALHTRRRFRLIPAPGHPNPPQLDMSLFIVHYGPSEHNDRIPATMVPYDERVNAIMGQRSYLLRAGQIRRKEFMLSDRVNWPSLPELTRQQMGPQATPRGVPQQMAYPPHAAPGPPAKRARHAQGQNQQQQPAAQSAPPADDDDDDDDDDEDVSRGDMFDLWTPRELAIERYRQNHEWMEEILSSAYRLGQIQPSDLNLGLKGELASLTQGIFAAHGGDLSAQSPEKPYVGRLDPGLADEFRKRVDKHIESTQAEMKSMEEEHAKLMASLNAASLLKAKEREVRSIPDPPAPEISTTQDRTEARDEQGKTLSPAAAAAAAAMHETTTTTPPFDEMLKEVEAALGRKIEARPRVKRVQDGGHLAPAAKPPTPAAHNPQMSRQPSQSGSHNSGLMMGDSDMDMGGTAAGLLDQMHTGFSSMSTPQAQASAAQSNAPTPSNANNAPSPGPVATLPPAQSAEPAGGPPRAAPQAAADVDMTGTTDGVAAKGPAAAAAAAAAPAPDTGTDSGDWIVVPKGGGAPPDNAAPMPAASAPPAKGPGPAAHAENDQQQQQQQQQHKPATAVAKPASSAATPSAFDQNDFSSLGDLDTAADAMAGYDAPDLDGPGGLGDDLDLQMDMEDSAFGDAFHGVGSAGTPGGDGHTQEL